MAGRADHEGLASLCCHECDPCWLAGAGVCEVGEFGDVVHLHGAAVVAELASVPQEPGDELFAGQGIPAGEAVVDDRCFAPCEGNASEPCDQWFPVVSRRRTASKQVRSPCGVSILALYRAAIVVTDELCLAASVLSSEVSMTHRSRSSRWTSLACR